MVKKAQGFGKGLLEKKPEKKEREGKNKGKPLIDATVVPADLKYPTDVDLLNTASRFASIKN